MVYIINVFKTVTNLFLAKYKNVSVCLSNRVAKILFEKKRLRLIQFCIKKQEKHYTFYGDLDGSSHIHFMVLHNKKKNIKNKN